MPLVYPLDMRSMLVDAGVKFRRPQFRLERRIATAALQNVLQVMETSPAAWRATWRTLPLKHAEASRVQAFVDALSGARRFLATDTYRPNPAAHLAGSGLPGATFTIQAVSPTRLTLLASGLTMSPGDLVGIEKGGRYALFRVLEAATSSGGSIAFDVAPSIPSHFAAGDICRVQRPVCLMLLDPSSPASLSDGMNHVEWTFSGVQAVQ
jgi:hypothetical protein